MDIAGVSSGPGAGGPRAMVGVLPGSEITARVAQPKEQLDDSKLVGNKKGKLHGGLHCCKTRGMVTDWCEALGGWWHTLLVQEAYC